MKSKQSEELARGILSGERRALARGITLVESSKAAHRQEADALLNAVVRSTGHSVRLGISGVPGVGKSTFIEAFGLHLIEQAKRVAVLAVDPSSRLTGGSILGDKTRMEQLSRHPSAFIRPSPSGGSLGGVARRTREALLLCEAAGYDVIIIETVGVGQSETAVADMTDLFMLLLLPSGGDELQGIKKGVVELADLVVVNKADGDMKTAAARAAAEYQSALRMLRPLKDEWRVPVLQVSSTLNQGMAEVWRAIERFIVTLGARGIDDKRAKQALTWMWSEIEDELLSRFKSDKEVAARISEIRRGVMDQEITPSAAARSLISAFQGLRQERPEEE